MNSPFLLFGGIGGLLIVLSSLTTAFAESADPQLIRSTFFAGLLTMWSGFLGYKTTTAALEETIHTGYGYLFAAHLFFGWMFYPLILPANLTSSVYVAVWLPSLFFTGLFYVFAAAGALISCWRELRLQCT